MRRSPRILAAVGTGLALPVVGLATMVGTASASPSATSVYNSAIKASGSQGVHYVSDASEQGVTIKVVGDTGTKSGTQSLTLHKTSLTETVSVILVNATGYVKGNAPALVNILGLTAAQSGTYNNKWISFPTSNSALAELVSGLQNKDVASELKMSGPFSFGPSKTINGQSAEAIKGKVSSSTGSSVPVILYVQSSGTPRPIQEVTNPGKGGTGIRGTVTFTKWGEKVHITAPAHATAMASLAPAG